MLSPLRDKKSFQRIIALKAYRSQCNFRYTIPRDRHKSKYADSTSLIMHADQPDRGKLVMAFTNHYNVS